MLIEFKYELGAVVIGLGGAPGVIVCAACDMGGELYLVRSTDAHYSISENWYRMAELEPVSDTNLPAHLLNEEPENND